MHEDADSPEQKEYVTVYFFYKLISFIVYQMSN